MCRHCHRRLEHLNMIGGSDVHVWHECKLKASSPQRQAEVYGVLFAKGLEGSIIGNNCPVAEEGNWQKCPFFTPLT